MSLHTLITYTTSSHTLALYSGFLTLLDVRGSHVAVLMGFIPLVSMKTFVQIGTHFAYRDTRGFFLLVS